MLKDGAGGKTTVQNLQYVRHATDIHNSLQTTVHKLLRLLNRRFLFT